MRGRRRAWRLAGLSLASLALADQALQHLALRDGRFLGRRVAPYDPPLFAASQERALALLVGHLERGEPPASSFVHDGELGWCPPRDGNRGGDRFDGAGARVGVEPLTLERVPGVRRVLVFGCSFVFGDEVRAAEAWPARLDAARPGLEVGNLGMSAYGIDQAFLRWRRDGRPLGADEVWLGFLPAAALRVTTLYRPAERHWGEIALFKPRFVLGGKGELELVPNPAPTLARTRALLTDPVAFADAMRRDAWVRRVPAAYAPRGTRLLHASGFARLALTALEWSGRDPLAALRDPRSEARRLVAAIGRRMRAEVEEEGARFRVVVLPGPADLDDFRRRDAPAWGDLLADWRSGGVEAFDVTPALDASDRASPGRLWASGGHYSAIGNGWVADALAPLVDS